jgi:ketosteroid isomerase-like protein
MIGNPRGTRIPRTSAGRLSAGKVPRRALERRSPRRYRGQVEIDRARAFVEAVTAHDLDAAEELLDPDVETVTPRGSLHGVLAAREVLHKAIGDDRFTKEQSAPEVEAVEGGDVIARTREVARWRESGEVAFERDFAVRLTLDGGRIVRIVVLPGGSPPTDAA